ncbi:MAG TPA: SusC/RagA family TonB-linked outer membrane protein [Saprospiraceae bacterium]|nr:SusC/RagA family TonB-linked outer membrane protein [Saprospiraceae bacterium]
MKKQLQLFLANGKTHFWVFLLALMCSFTMNAQTTSRIIKGVVTDEKNETLIGASVLIQGTSIGTTTDFDGKYEIEVNGENPTLEFSYLGMKSQQITVGESNIIDVTLKEDAFGLEEVVVSGVASATPKKNLTISVEKLDADNIKDVHASSAVNALQGKVAGLKVVVANGLPGGGASVRLRGSTSLTGSNKPLIILDGNRLNTNLADINLDDIETFEVVKGAAAAALYGSQAGNGVIVLTSKRGKKNKLGKSTITVRSEYGAQQISKYLDLATHHPYQLADDQADYDYTRYKGVYYFQGGHIGSRLVTENGYADQEYAQVYNHQEEFFKTGIYHTEYVGLTGHGEKSNYLISIENNRQEGIINYTGGYQRNNLKFNMDHRLFDNFQISTSNLIMKAQSQNPGSYRTFQDLLFLSPDVNLFAKNKDSTDFLFEPDPWKVGLVENPLYPLANTDRESSRFSIVGNMKAKYSITNWATLEAKYAYEHRNTQAITFQDKGYYIAGSVPGPGYLYKNNFKELGQDVQVTLNLNKQVRDFTNKFKLSYLFEKTERDFFSVSAKELFAKGVPHLNNYDPKTAKLNSYDQKIVSIDYFGIYDFDYKDKYLFSGLYRIDGSSLFGREVRWNPYYRISGGYRLTEDIKLPKIQELKLRVAYGTAGQRPGFGWKDEVFIVSDGAGKYRHTIANKYLKPSTTKELEIGMDVNFLKRFSLTAAYAVTNTEDAIYRTILASHIGASYQYRNIGTISGTSLETSLQTDIFNKKNFSWTTNLTFDKATQKVTKLNIPPFFNGPRSAFYVAEGEPFGSMYGYDWVKSMDQMARQIPDGKSINDFEVNSDGYVILKGTAGTKDEAPIPLDIDNDGTADKIIIGNSNPNFNLSLQNSLEYKGIQLGFLFSYKNGGNIYNYTRQYAYRENQAPEIDQYGKPENEKKTINYYGALYKSTEINSHFIEDGTYLKLRELSLSYTINKKTLAKLVNFTQSVRLGIQVRNVYTWTKYTGYDPEVTSGNDLTNYYYDNFGYPNFRTYSGSIKFIF